MGKGWVGIGAMASDKPVFVGREVDMKRASLAYLFPLFASAVLVTACSSGQSSSTSSASSSTAAPLMQARDKLIADVKACNSQYDYNPDSTSGIAENALAPHELEWRQCAYDAIHRYAQANPTLASRYDQLITEDMQMTTAIQQGTMTRTKRRARDQQLIAQIKSAEEQQIQATAMEQQRQMEQVRSMVDSMRGFAAMKPTM